MPLSDQRHSSYKFDGRQYIVTHNAMLSSGNMAEYEELKRLSKLLEEQAVSAMKMVMELQQENETLKLANIRGTEGESYEGEDYPRFSPSLSSNSQSSRESKKHLMYGSKHCYPVDSIVHMLSGSSGEICGEDEEMKKQREAELNQKDVEILSLREQLDSLKKTIDLLKTDHSRDPDSYFNEITSLITQLTANQVELGELKVNMAGYEELKRRSKPLEEQASSAMKMFIELQQENEALKLANIRGTEGESYEGEDYPRFSPSLSSNSQSSRESKKHLMYGSKHCYPVDSIVHMLSGSSGEICGEDEEMKKQREAELNQKDVEILSLREQLDSLKKTIDLLKTDHSRDPDSYFNEITSLITQLTANQVELGELKVNMAGYEELKRRSKPLEEQASSAMGMFIELQQENEALKLANIRGTEGESYEGFSPSLSSTAKQNEYADIESMKTSLVLYENKVEEIRTEWKEAQQMVAILKSEMTSKDNVIKKLKDRVSMLTVPVGSAEELRRSLPPSGWQIHPARLQEAEVEIKRLRGQLENAGGGAEKVGELEAENEQLHKIVKELEEDLVKSLGKAEEMMNHLANVAEQSKTFRSSMMMRESEINRLQVSATISAISLWKTRDLHVPSVSLPPPQIT